ncbi:CAAX amino protease [Leptolyngbya iicbica]|uniref:CAAX protease n=2 Tax=Cyanophyceae TaxID=3028117 RepID=A0A4Q7E4E5_9CYAN|nr:CAAX amino protease [Leptolyngbya sp. LK]RZM76643.1 CAAX protease [Leptolyngbya sp. LK]
MIDRFWYVIGYVFALNSEAFRIAASLPQGVQLALLIVLFAGLSRSIGQCAILFFNQVKPLRFFLSLLISAVLFVGGFLALVGSTWLITLLPWSVSLSFSTLVIVLGAAYAPLLFSFLGALPYAGQPILNLLSVWNLLAMVVGFGAVTGLNLPESFGYVGFGWVLLQIIEQTIGRPIAAWARWLADTVAGVDLKTDRDELMEHFRDRVDSSTNELKTEVTSRLNTVKQELQAAVPVSLSDSAASVLPKPAGLGEVVTTATAQPTVTKGAERSHRQLLRTILGVALMLILTLVVLALLKPIRVWWFGWFGQLPTLLRFVLQLTWIGVVAVIVAGLLAPLETLGWWAGWFDDEVNTTENTGDLARPIADAQQIQRYVVYLDGIGISSFEYLPDVETFLDALAPQLPEDVALVRGIMPYSVMNRPLDEDRTLSFFWRYADKLRFANPASILGLIVNIRNILIVGVSADKRYGPLYNQGIAQIVFSGLLKNGYQLGSGTPVTFIGYSGGGQMSCASAPFLKRAIAAPIDVISLGGVMSANNNFLKLEHCHHLKGDKDVVEPLGAIMFPGRWQVFWLSFWNRAKRLGKVTLISMGPVGHNVPGGILDPKVMLADGRSSLQQTIDTINTILKGELASEQAIAPAKPSNYTLYMESPLCQLGYFPLAQSLDPALFQPIGPWLGRLILPKKEARSQVKGTLIELHHAPPEYAHLVGQTLPLRWDVAQPDVQDFVKAVTRDVNFSADAEYNSKFGGLVLPDRINRWRQVDPLESLAAGHPIDDITVMLAAIAVRPDSAGQIALYTPEQPVEVSGRYYALVQFIAPVGADHYRVRHFNRATRRFDGPETVMSNPAVLIAKDYGSYPSTTRQIERSPCNEQGWYVYGTQDAAGQFVVQAWMPRALMRLQPDRVIFGSKATYRHIRQETWAHVAAKKGQISSVLGTPRDNGSSAAIQSAIDDWREGDRALVLHTYGGIGGAKKEPAAATPIFFGHFAFGVAEVIRDPLADELRFDIRYYQVYTQNTDGLVAGTLHWSRYLGHRQLGWLGNRPTCDIVLKLSCFTEGYGVADEVRSPLQRMERFLVSMTARYRIGDGTGATYVGPANNCSQDSNQALFAAIQQIVEVMGDNEAQRRRWEQSHPEQAARFEELRRFGHDLKQALQPLGKPRADWETNAYNLGSTIEDKPLQNLMTGITSWRTLLPRKASDTVARKFLAYGAAAWILRTNQVGGDDPDIEPIAPMTL